METEKNLCSPEHIQYGMNASIAKLFGVTPPQVTRWDSGQALSEKVLIRASRCGLTKGQILDAYDRRREDFCRGGNPSEKWKTELQQIVESLIN